jgi:hypothetical protein
VIVPDGAAAICQLPSAPKLPGLNAAAGQPDGGGGGPPLVMLTVAVVGEPALAEASEMVHESVPVAVLESCGVDDALALPSANDTVLALIAQGPLATLRVALMAPVVPPVRVTEMLVEAPTPTLYVLEEN